MLPERSMPVAQGRESTRVKDREPRAFSPKDPVIIVNHTAQ